MSPLSYHIICYFYAKKENLYYFAWENGLQYRDLYPVHKPLNTTIGSDFAIDTCSVPCPFAVL